MTRKRVRRLMKMLGLEAIYPRRSTSKPAPGHKIYPYLLRGLDITRPNQVWSADVSYVPMRKGFVYVIAIIDWYSRYVLAWSLSTTLEADFCVEALKEALWYGTPEIFNTDQGSQFTSDEFVNTVLDAGVQMSMDGRGRWMDNVFVERLWRSLKYEECYLHAYDSVKEARQLIWRWFNFYNTQRPYQALGYRRPIEVHNTEILARSTDNGATTPVLILPTPDVYEKSNAVVALNTISSELQVIDKYLPL